MSYLPCRPWLIVAAIALSACASAPPPPPPPAPPPPVVQAPPPAPLPVCDAAGAQFAVGQGATPALEAAVRHRANAAAVRLLKPGQMVTQEFDASRVNLELDARNRVKAVRCG